MTNITELFNHCVTDETEDIRKKTLVVVIGDVNSSVMEGVQNHSFMGTAFRCEVVHTPDTFDLKEIVDYLEDPHGIDLFVQHCTSAFRNRLFTAAFNSLGHSNIDRSRVINLYELMSDGKYEQTAGYYFDKQDLVWLKPMPVR